MDWFTAVLSIGSNKGDTRGNLETAIQYLGRESHTRIQAVSGFYKTEPQDYIDQDWFINAAVKIGTQLEPGPLMAFLKAVEKEMDPGGKAFRYGPRIIDLDIIYFEDRIIRTDQLTVPHPKMHERCFVLQPVCDIAPEAVHPVFNRTARELLDDITHRDGQTIIRVKPKEE